MSGEGGPIPDRATVPAHRLVGEAIDGAAQAIVRVQPDVPLTSLPELRRALQGIAMRDVLTARLTLFQAGHDEEADDMLPIGWLPFMEAMPTFLRAKAEMSADHRDLEAMRRDLVDGVALMLAGIDRLDRATKRGEG